MRVRAYIKHRINEHPQGATRGDIWEILPIDADPGKLIFRTYFPVDIDLNVPCGSEFRPPYKCSMCADNHPDTCDIIKYKTATWITPGGIFKPPKLDKKRRYKVDLSSLIPAKFVGIAFKENKTKQEKIAIKNYVNSIQPYNKNIIEDKTK